MLVAMLRTLEAFTLDRLDVSRLTLQQYSIAVGQFVTFSNGDLERFREFLRDVRERTSARTANNKRAAVLRVWRWGHEQGMLPEPPNVPKFREPARAPTAYTVEQVGRLLRVCRHAEPVGATWTGRHWQGLVLTIYDTASRVGALLTVPRSCLADGWLLIPGEHHKHGRDTRHRLHADTIAVLDGLPRDKLLFPWPLSRRSIWPKFKTILHDAGLPTGRRDLFHRLRRTSYSYVARELGVHAAGEHAGHAGDLSRFYLDRSVLGLPDAIDVLPRPNSAAG